MSLKEYMHIQPRVIKMLMNSFNNNRVAHAYLFEGEKGQRKRNPIIWNYIRNWYAIYV